MGGGAVAELSRWCGRCGTELRSGARFCAQCGQRVLGETPAADAAPREQGRPEQDQAEPAERFGPGSTEVGTPAAVGAQPPAVTAEPLPPVPGPDSPPRNEWSHWYSSTRIPLEPLAAPPPVYPPQATVPPPGQQRPYRPPFEPARPATMPAGGDRPSHALFWSALFAVVAVAVVVALIQLHPFSHHETVDNAASAAKTARPTTSAAARSRVASSSSSPSAAASTSASLSSTAGTEQRAASTVDAMLAGSVTDRTAIDGAYTDVDRCGPNLADDAAVFNRAVTSRRALLATLATMPGRSALPAALLSDLTGAWQASIAADQDLATWADDEVTQGCVTDDTSDPGYRSSVTPDSQATEDKIEFAAVWNPIAARYGLTSYQPSQL